jgi:hypothetical protein
VVEQARFLLRQQENPTGTVCEPLEHTSRLPTNRVAVLATVLEPGDWRGCAFIRRTDGD